MSERAIKQAEPKPFYYEAREYCDHFGINDIDECERVRLSMCIQEFHRRMKPWTEMLAKRMAYSLPGEDPSLLDNSVRQMYEDMQKKESEALGLSIAATPQECPNG